MPVPKKIIRKPYETRTRQPMLAFDDGQCQQQFKEECDINNILAKYQKTGAVTHANNRAAEYGFATSLDFRQSMEIVVKAKTMFNELPSTIRRKFGGSPEAFLDFVQNPANASEMVEMGLVETPDQEPQQIQSVAPATTITPPATKKEPKAEPKT